MGFFHLYFLLKQPSSIKMKVFKVKFQVYKIPKRTFNINFHLTFSNMSPKILNISGIFLGLYMSSSKTKWCHNSYRTNGASNIIVQGSRDTFVRTKCSRTGGTNIWSHPCPVYTKWFCCKWLFSQVAKRSILGGFSDFTNLVSRTFLFPGKWIAQRVMSWHFAHWKISI